MHEPHALARPAQLDWASHNRTVCKELNWAISAFAGMTARTAIYSHSLMKQGPELT
jgi:hypothetical protein